MKRVCIIPARGGSKRIPRKNIKDFLGKPIIAYSIEAAIESNLFDEIMVSTDDDEIVEIAKKYGAKIPFLRSEKNSNDYATTYEVLEEVLNEYKNLNQHFEQICCIYPCAPLVSIKNLIEAGELLDKNNYDTVFPVVPFTIPLERALEINKFGKTVFVNQDFALTRSQDLALKYYDAGQFYFCDTAQLLKNKKLITDNCGSIILNEINAQDIDNEMDWSLAEMKYKLINNH